MKKKMLLTLLLVNATIFARTVTLEESINLAMENEKNIKIAEKDITISGYNVSSAFKSALPAIVYEGQYQTGEHQRKMNNGIDLSKDGYNQSISIAQPLFRGGSVIGAIKGAKIYESSYSLQYLGEKRDARLKVIKLYSDILNNQKDLIAYETSRKELRKDYEKQNEQLNMRLIVKADVLKTEYSLMDIEAKITAAKNNIKIAKDKLKISLGIPTTEEIDVIDFQVPENLSKGIDLDYDVTQAKDRSITALLARNNVGLAEIEKIMARAEMLPNVDAFGGYGAFTEQPKFSDTMDNAEWRGGVKVSWNVFQFGKSYDNYKAAREGVEKSIIEEDQVKDNIQIGVTSAYLDLLKLEKIKESKYKAMLAATENYKIDKERYNAGLISVVDYLISETNWRTSQVEYNQTITDYYYAFEKYRSLLI